MPVIDEDGRIGYYEWESAVEFEWLGISREDYPTTQDINEIVPEGAD